MDLYFNNQKVSKLPIVPESTIGNVKKYIYDWLNPQGFTNYNIKLVFGNKTELSPVVFTNNNYDNVNFIQYKNVLKGGSIYITSVQTQPTHINKNPKVVNNPCKGKTVYVLSNQPYGDQDITSRVYSDISGLLEYYYRTEMMNEYEAEFGIAQAHTPWKLTASGNNILPGFQIDYNNEGVRQYILNEIDENNWYQISTNTVL